MIHQTRFHIEKEGKKPYGHFVIPVKLINQMGWEGGNNIDISISEGNLFSKENEDWEIESKEKKEWVIDDEKTIKTTFIYLQRIVNKKDDKFCRTLTKYGHSLRIRSIKKQFLDILKAKPNSWLYLIDSKETAIPFKDTIIASFNEKSIEGILLPTEVIINKSEDKFKEDYQRKLVKELRKEGYKVPFFKNRTTLTGSNIKRGVVHIRRANKDLYQDTKLRIMKEIDTIDSNIIANKRMQRKYELIFPALYDYFGSINDLLFDRKEFYIRQLKAVKSHPIQYFKETVDNPKDVKKMKKI